MNEFMKAFIFGWTERTLLLPDERYCDRVPSGVCERTLSQFLNFVQKGARFV